MADDKLLKIMAEGVDVWNQWRRENPGFPDLSGASLFGIGYQGRAPLPKGFVTDLTGINLSKAELDRAFIESADLSGADLSGAVLSRVNLRRAKLRNANLIGADLYEADLYQADLEGARLQGAKLTRARLVEVNLSGANIEHCNIYGTAAWDVTVSEKTNQRSLVITDPARTWESAITVDNLEVAHFVYLLLNNQKIRDVIHTITSRAVLILGHFTQSRKRILDLLHDTLRDYGYVPILFDFKPSPRRDLTETVQLLANMSKFVIADLTDAKSIPQELSHIIPLFPSVPVQPILLASQEGYAMFEHWRRYNSVLPEFLYESEEHLVKNFESSIIRRVQAWEAGEEDLRRLRERVKELEAQLAQKESLS